MGTAPRAGTRLFVEGVAAGAVLAACIGLLVNTCGDEHANEPTASSTATPTATPTSTPTVTSAPAPQATPQATVQGTAQAPSPEDTSALPNIPPQAPVPPIPGAGEPEENVPQSTTTVTGADLTPDGGVSVAPPAGDAAAPEEDEEAEAVDAGEDAGEQEALDEEQLADEDAGEEPLEEEPAPAPTETIGAGPFLTTPPPWGSSSFVPNPDAGAGQFTTEWPSERRPRIFLGIPPSATPSSAPSAPPSTSPTARPTPFR